MVLMTTAIGDLYVVMWRLMVRLYTVGLEKLIKFIHQTVKIIYLIKMTCMPMMHKALINNILEHDQNRIPIAV